jgi:hypothetical protein
VLFNLSLHFLFAHFYDAHSRFVGGYVEYTTTLQRALDGCKDVQSGKVPRGLLGKINLIFHFGTAFAEAAIPFFWRRVASAHLAPAMKSEFTQQYGLSASG